MANATFTIDAVNDAPVISDTGKPESLFGIISEDSTAGFTVQLGDLLQQYSDVDKETPDISAFSIRGDPDSTLPQRSGGELVPSDNRTGSYTFTGSQFQRHREI